MRLTTGAEHELDAIVFATGFDAMTGALREIDIRNAPTAPCWLTIGKGGRCTYLGLMVSGFPNMFRHHRARAARA